MFSNSSALDRVSYAFLRSQGLDPREQETEALMSVQSDFNDNLESMTATISERNSEVSALAEELIRDVAALDPLKAAKEQLAGLEKKVTLLTEKKETLHKEIIVARKTLLEESQTKNALLKQLKELKEEKEKLRKSEKINVFKESVKLFAELAMGEE